mgnify:FL=1
MGFIGKQPTPVPLTSSDITDGIISTAKIADDAVTGAKIENTPSIANGLTLSDGNLVVASGHGLDFSANSSASGMSSELFDHYEEGTFSLTVSDATSGGNTGSIGVESNTYTRIGDTVIMNISLINITTTGLTGATPLYLQGSPFTPRSGSYGVGAVLANLVDVEASCFNLNLYINAGQNYFQFNQSLDNAGSGSTHVNKFDNANADIFATLVIKV